MASPKVISCSRRTDIPRCYSVWLEQALASGSVSFRVPRGGVRSVSLAPADIHSLVFWSKDYDPLLSRPSLVEQLRQLNCYFHFTITGLGQSVLEPEIPAWQDAVATLAALVRLFGAARINWRFDPVVHWQDGNRRSSNLSSFPKIAARVAAAGVTTCTFSLAQRYQKNERRARRLGIGLVELSQEQGIAAAEQLAASAAGFGIRLSSCAAAEWLRAPGVSRGRCVDAVLLNALRTDGLKASLARDGSQRQLCGCSRSIDIGSYSQRCGAVQCAYCYAS